MHSDVSFLEDLRKALNVPGGEERNRSMHPELFVKDDKTHLLDSIANRSYKDKLLLIKELSENCAALNTTLHIVDSLQEAEDVTVEIARTKPPEFSNNRHIIGHNHPDIAAMKLWKRFNRESVTVHTTYHGDEDINEKTIASYIGITAPDISVAESATLMQFTSSGCPRSTSLIPSIHIALIRSENLVANLEEAYALLEQHDPKDSFVFISGPSKTADIEAHLVHGAHGPKELHIILLKEAEPIEEITPKREEDTNNSEDISEEEPIELTQEAEGKPTENTADFVTEEVYTKGEESK